MLENISLKISVFDNKLEVQECVYRINSESSEFAIALIRDLAAKTYRY